MEPVVEVVYNGRDISAELTPFLSSFVFVDAMNGQADTLELVLGQAQVDATRWLDDWYPDKGMELRARFGWTGQALVSAGSFDVDEVAVSSPPLAVVIRAQSAGVSRAVRTRIGRAYEDTTLGAVLQQVAGRIGAKLVGSINPDPAIDRATQFAESEWQFASRLAAEYGYVLKLANNNKALAVLRLAEVQAPVRTLAAADLLRFDYRDQIADVPARTTVRYHDAHTGALVVYGVSADGQAVPVDKASADERLRHVRTASAADARARAAALAERHALDKTVLELVLPGDPLLAAGLCVAVSGLGRLTGRYVIVQATHTIDGGGYTTALQLKRTGDGA
ncbi:phage late control D family protein [Rhodoferax sp.]|uniref:phage late control D family protein n=1 Tax=Rhodoferax sp. TaxID=50421 RepID=UPI002629913E|nr:contractile injection system protein, VgrG/Pvc8 family [Rhodoferax sp.]MDD3938078.1 contractile injection system protein, VgrG/Pvc8 family [Rhodoferax sp.]